jgi:ubiquinone/menaquinone biosynthesis C-methylase UbiE
MHNPGEVERYYDENADLEWRRLSQDRTEFALTLRALDEHLPAGKLRILDVGGGPGRYAIELARRGHLLTLADFSARELDLARVNVEAAGVQLEAICKADARDLSRFADSSFDAVLLLGPLYHLLEASDRERAVREARRILKDGGTVFAAFITRYAVLRFWARYDPTRIAGDWSKYERQLADGRVTDNYGFTDIYLSHPTEVSPFMTSAGFSQLDLIGCEGVISMIRDKVDRLPGDDWERWMDVNYRLGKDPSTHGVTEHLLFVGRKA